MYEEYSHRVLLLREERCEVDVGGDITWRTVFIRNWDRCFVIWKRIDEFLSLLPIMNNVINTCSKISPVLYCLKNDEITYQIKLFCHLSLAATSQLRVTPNS